ncbi:MAG TPA: ATPase [Clostridiales bacterium]|jgi:MinD superfamily P-loop ATPase|nr:ATPase [Clostridiales bacterium]
MKKLLILSGKGGTGKTTAAAAFIDFIKARAFADCDVDAPNLHLVAKLAGAPRTWEYYGTQKARIDPKICTGCGACYDHCRFQAIKKSGSVYQVDAFACEGCGVCEYVCPVQAVALTEDVSGIQMLYTGDAVFSTAQLKMGRGNSGKLVSAVKSALSEHAPETDLAVIDGSPGIGCPVIASVTGVDLVLIVAEPSLSGISDMKRIVSTARILNVPIALCVNKFDLYEDHTDAIEAWCEEEDIPFAGRIPYDHCASEAINQGHSLAETGCPAALALRCVLTQVLELLEVQECG